MSDEKIAQRLRKIRGELKISAQKTMSVRLELSAGTWGALEGGGNKPSAETLLKLAELGFSPDWILLGDEPMRLEDKRRMLDRKVEEERYTDPLMGQLFAVLKRTYAELVQVASTAEMARRAADEYDEIVATAKTDEARDSQVKRFERNLRKELAAPPAAPTSEGVPDPGSRKQVA